jgi:magnesium transporter
MMQSFPSCPSGSGGPSHVGVEPPVWLDLFDPDEAERAEAARLVGGQIPTAESLRQIETSQRMRREGDRLYMSIPAVNAAGSGAFAVRPVGFVLSPDRLVTVRFAALKSFEAVGKQLAAGGASPPALTARSVLLRIFEELIGVLADRLEAISDDLHAVSASVFHASDSRGRESVRSNRLLRIQMQAVGRLGDRASAIADALTGLERIIPFSVQAFDQTRDQDLLSRLTSVQQECATLKDYEAELFSKVQFLMDAMVGLIGIAQGDIFKILTIVSIVGIPPTFVASLYGMNFKTMPELSWHYGYAWGLSLMVISAVAPVVWFKVKGWF